MRYSWRQARDPALPSGDINATVLNYAALKFFRTSICSEAPPQTDEACKPFARGLAFSGRQERTAGQFGRARGVALGEA
ncbi:MAG: hypothetical protein ACLQM8_13325, partial [Limisphaerales bacterium]